MRVIGEDGRSLGIMRKDQALRLAREAGLDLIVVADNMKPPTAKLADWGKYNYHKKKKRQQARQGKSHRSVGLKQMRFGVKIGVADRDVKLRKVKQFLDEGHKVRFTIMLKGREMQHKDLAFEMANQIIEQLAEHGSVEQAPRMAGRQISVILKSNPRKHA